MSNYNNSMSYNFNFPGYNKNSDFHKNSLAEDLAKQTKNAFDDLIDDDKANINLESKTIVKPKTEKSIQDGVKYFYGFTENLIKLELTPTEFKILLAIIDKLKWGNVVSLTQAQIAKDIEINRSVVSRNWTKLIEKKVLINNEGCIYLNTNFFFVGLYNSMDKQRRSDFENASIYDDVTIKHMHKSKGTKK